MRDGKIKRNFDAINLQRRKLIAEDSGKLLTLAIALKAEVEAMRTGNRRKTSFARPRETRNRPHTVENANGAYRCSRLEGRIESSC